MSDTIKFGIWEIRDNDIYTGALKWDFSPDTSHPVRPIPHNLKDAVQTVIKGNQPTTPHDKIKSGLKNVLMRMGKPQLASPLIASLKLERPEVQTKSTNMNRPAKKSFKKAADTPLLDPENHKNITLGEYAYDPDQNAVFHGTDKKYIKTPPYAARAIGLIIENFPIAVSLSEMEQEIKPEERTHANGNAIDATSIENALKAFGSKMKKAQMLDVSGIQRVYDSDTYTLAIPLDQLDDDIKATMGLLTYDNLSISEEMGQTWVNGKPSSLFTENIPLMIFMIENKGKIVQPEKFRTANQTSIIGRVNRLNGQLGTGKTAGTIHMDGYSRFAFCESTDEWHRILRERHDTSNSAGRLRTGNETLAPQFL